MRITIKELKEEMKTLNPENRLLYVYNESKGIEWDSRDKQTIAELKRMIKGKSWNIKVLIKFFNEVSFKASMIKLRAEEKQQKEFAKIFDWKNATCKKTTISNSITNNIYRTYTDIKNRLKCSTAFNDLAGTEIYSRI